MTAILTPPPTSPASPPTPPSPEPRAASRVVAILTIVLGATLILGAFASSALGAIGAATRGGSGTLTADAAGVRGLDVDVAAADFRIVYGDGDAASLDVDGAAADWHLRRDGDRLVVSTQRSWWSVIRPFSSSDTAVLTLPRALESVPLDANLSLSAGSLRAEGTYATLDLTLAAGAMDVSGRADVVTADVSAGRLLFDLSRVETLGVKLSAGSIEGGLTGTAPRSVSADLSAGRLALVLPDAAYQVSTDASAGEIDNRLRTDQSSPNRITVTVSAGFASLRS